MNGLPTGRVSKHRNPHVHRAEFQVPWAQLHQRMLWERKRAVRRWNWDQIFKSMVLVSPSEDRILATTVDEYVVQTWGQNRELVTRFLIALERELCRYTLGTRQPRLHLPGTWTGMTKRSTNNRSRFPYSDRLSSIIAKQGYASGVCRGRFIHHRRRGGTAGLAVHSSSRCRDREDPDD
jgi:hypothetical protein